MEGRDIGTNVFPNADVKIYLDATPEERARRRQKQNEEKGINIPFEEIVENIKFRDNNDKTSPVAPLKQAEDAIYIDSSKIEDSYFVFGLELPNIIYSHMTALYFHGLSIKAPNDKYDITVPNNYFNYKIKNHNVFYVDKDIYELGLTEIKTPMGNNVRFYDMERCICDIIRSKNRMDLEHVKYSIREYFKRKDKNLIKFSNYAKKNGH